MERGVWVVGMKIRTTGAAGVEEISREEPTGG